jgi:hypothetical protein
MPRPIRQDFEFNTRVDGVRRLDDLNDRMEDLTDEIGDMTDASDDLGRAAGNAESGLLSFSGGLQAALGAVTGAAIFETAISGIQGVADSTIGLTNEINRSMSEFEAQTGITGAALEGYESIAERLFTAGYGEDFEAVVDAMQRVTTVTSLSGVMLERTTERALIFGETFDRDINESIAVADTTAAAFGRTAFDVFDTMTVAMQESGDQGEDLLDTFNEYSANFADMGFTFEEFASLMTTGLQAGARNTDDLADAMREYNIRLNDGSSEAAFLTLGLEDTFDAFQSGGITASEAWEDVRFALASLEDPVLRAQLGAEIFGSKWEDTSGDVILAMEPLADQFGAVAGATDAAGDALARGPAQAMERFQRGVGVAISNAIDPLVDRFNVLASTVIDGVGAWLINTGIPKFQEFFGILGEGVSFVTDLATQFIDVESAIGGALDLANEYIDAYTSWFDLPALTEAFDTGGFEGLASELMSQIATGFGNVTGFWTDILEQVASGLGDLGEWVSENLWMPLVSGIEDSTQVQDIAEAIGSIMSQGLDAVIGVIGDVAAWARENIIQPIITALTGGGGGEGEGGVATAGAAFGDNILENIASAFVNLSKWIFTNIINPFVVGFTGMEAGPLVAQLLLFGADLLGRIADGIPEIPGWITENILAPLIAAVVGIDYAALGMLLLDVGGEIMRFIGEGIGDLGAWLVSDVITPLITAITGLDLSGLAGAARSIGTGILDGITGGLSGLANEFIQILNDMIPDEIDLGSIRVGPYERHVRFDLPDNPIQQFQRGGLLDGIGVVGERGPELALTGMPARIIPNATSAAAVASAFGGGGGGGDQVININAPINLPGVTNAREFLAALEREAAKNNRRLAVR